jgi:hypothetical protein
MMLALAPRPPLPRRFRSGGPVLAATLALGGAACGTVDPGPSTGPPQGCNASPQFFAEHVWPEYLVADGCGASDCHDAATGHGYFRLGSVTGTTFDPRLPTSMWPDVWRSNLQNAQRLLDCGDPAGSLLVTVPEGRGRPHPPGDVVKDHAQAEAVIAAWAAAR